MKVSRILICLVLLTALVIGLQLLAPDPIRDFKAWAKESALKVFINDAPSRVETVEVKGTQYVPLHFAVEPGKVSYQVTLSYDAASKTLKIEKIRKGKKLRGDHNCERCSGTGDCQACYPAGSGKNIQGTACPVCNGTGDCTMCNGTGKY
jgi:hypothetical protein